MTVQQYPNQPHQVLTQDPEKGENLCSSPYSEVEAHVCPWCKNVRASPTSQVGKISFKISESELSNRGLQVLQHLKNGF